MNCYHIHFIAIIILCCEKCYSNNSKVLIFGGNGFMGAATVEQLLKEGYDISIANRGNWYWDAEKRIRGKVQHFYYNRQHPIQNSPELVKFISENHFKTVIDFSGYNVYYIQQALSVLNGHVDLYMYISTDSVYEVCKKNHTMPTLESDSIRPHSANERNELSTLDQYGNLKLMCEEEIISQRIHGGPPYLFLRLPDVVGPRDNTKRWWFYQIWLKIASVIKKPVVIPRTLASKQISMVYSLDVARLILNILTDADKHKDDVFNIAYPTTTKITLLSLMQDITGNLGVALYAYTTQDNNVIYLFPSVKNGPINVTKASKLLNWKPTPWNEAVAKTVQFYEDAMSNDDFNEIRMEVLRWLQSKIMPDEMKEFYEGVHSVYPKILEKSKDEL